MKSNKYSPERNQQSETRCPRCRGKGQIKNRPCSTCYGTGRIYGL